MKNTVKLCTPSSAHLKFNLPRVEITQGTTKLLSAWIEIKNYFQHKSILILSFQCEKTVNIQRKWIITTLSQQCQLNLENKSYNYHWAHYYELFLSFFLAIILSFKPFHKFLGSEYFNSSLKVILCDRCATN